MAGSHPWGEISWAASRNGKAAHAVLVALVPDFDLQALRWYDSHPWIQRLQVGEPLCPQAGHANLSLPAGPRRPCRNCTWLLETLAAFGDDTRAGIPKQQITEQLAIWTYQGAIELGPARLSGHGHEIVRLSPTQAANACAALWAAVGDGREATRKVGP